MGFRTRIPLLSNLLRPRQSFDKLRSFHLTTRQGAAIPLVAEQLQAAAGGTITNQPLRKQKTFSKVTPLLRTVDGVIPIPPIFYFGLAVLCSVLFVLIIPSVFHGATVEGFPFKAILDDTAQLNPGLVLIGEDVDIDIDEPSTTIRWSVLACGQEYVLPNSSGVLGSSLCGLPNLALNIYVDGSPTGTYDPALIPYDMSGERRNIQNLVQFDSDHTLDVHNDRLYPFDTYFLSSTIRAISFENNSIPISKIATIDLTSSFVVESTDNESYLNTNATPSRDLAMHIRRPFETRAIVLLLFASSWFLTHICMGNLLLARYYTRDVKPIIKFLIVNGAVGIAVPQLRNSMPDAPGLDGVLIDSIGFFPQMIICGFSLVILLLTVIVRELNNSENSNYPLLPQHAPAILPPARKRSASKHKPPPPLPLPTSSSSDIARYNLYRINKHLKGEFVFPPVRIEDLHSIPEETPKSSTHRRFKTSTQIPKSPKSSERS